jgi:hypothetical protein
MDHYKKRGDLGTYVATEQAAHSRNSGLQRLTLFFLVWSCSDIHVGSV